MPFISPERVFEIVMALNDALPEYGFVVDRPDDETVDISIIYGPVKLTERPDGYEYINDYYLEGYEPEARTVFEIVIDIAKEGVVEEQWGEFGVSTRPSHYVELHVGMFSTPYKVKSRV